jgi:hypothetical protein
MEFLNKYKLVKEDYVPWNLVVRTVDIHMLKVIVLNSFSVVVKDAFVSRGSYCDSMCNNADKKTVVMTETSQSRILSLSKQTIEYVDKEAKLYNENKERQT